MICEPLDAERDPCEPADAKFLRLRIGVREETQLPVQIKGTRKDTPNWTWNGDVEKPTLRPSIKAKFYNWDAEEMQVCHVFVNDGMVQHLSDCTCGRAGTTEPLQELETEGDEA